MIHIDKLNKEYNGRKVLNNINLELPRYGLVSILGNSGCGKTTLLNSIGLFCDSEGNIVIDGKNINKATENDKDLFRCLKVGFIFQDYKLFMNETVKSNVMLALDIKASDTKKMKEQRCRDLLSLVGLRDKKDEQVKNLSGGEQQRVAIARALSNSPNIILADEPTGNLDEVNSGEVLRILKSISRESLVIVVTHDQNLALKFSDIIFHMKDGKIIKKDFIQNKKKKEKLPLLSIKNIENKPKLPINFIFKHTLSTFKQSKFRNVISLLTTSISLVAIGLSVSLTSLISSNLERGYSSFFGDNKLIVSNRQQTYKSKIKSLNQETVNKVYAIYKDHIKYKGIYYFNDFENMFTYCNLNVKHNNYYPIDFLNLRSFNEYIVDDKYDLKANEIVLGLTMSSINDLCFRFNIERSEQSLKEFIKRGKVEVSCYLENEKWNYTNEFSVNIVDIYLTSGNKFVHNLTYWNEYIFEICCGLSNTNLINENSSHPWDLIKGEYFYFEDYRDEFISDMLFSTKYQNISCEILDSKFYKQKHMYEHIDLCNEVVLYEINEEDNIDKRRLNYYKKVSSKISHPIFGTNGGYAIYGNNLMMGFSRPTFLSDNIAELEDAIDLVSYIKIEEDNANLSANSVIKGYFAGDMNQNLSFIPNAEIYIGEEPKTYKEIVISQGLANRLKLLNPVGKKIYISFPVFEEILPNDYVSRNFEICDLKISGVSKDSGYIISHHEYWSILFFLLRLGVSVFNLNVNSIAFNIDENSENEVISLFNRAFPNLYCYSPMQSIKSSISNTCSYLSNILVIISITTSFIALLIMLLNSALYLNNIRSDLGLIRCLGIGKKESQKMIYSHTLLSLLMASIIASFELFFVSLITTNTIKNIFLIDTKLYINPMAFILMFVICLINLVTSILFMKHKFKNISILNLIYGD